MQSHSVKLTTNKPALTGPKAVTPAQGTPVLVTAQIAVHVRDCASVHCKHLRYLYNGKTVYVLGCTENGWAVLADGGYVNSNFLSINCKGE
jgi:hypothetical protein